MRSERLNLTCLSLCLYDSQPSKLYEEKLQVCCKAKRRFTGCLNASKKKLLMSIYFPLSTRCSILSLRFFLFTRQAFTLFAHWLEYRKCTLRLLHDWVSWWRIIMFALKFRAFLLLLFFLLVRVRSWRQQKFSKQCCVQVHFDSLLISMRLETTKQFALTSFWIILFLFSPMKWTHIFDWTNTNVTI